MQMRKKNGLFLFWAAVLISQAGIADKIELTYVITVFESGIVNADFEINEIKTEVGSMISLELVLDNLSRVEIHRVTQILIV